MLKYRNNKHTISWNPIILQGCRGYGNSHGDPHTHGNGNQIFPCGDPHGIFEYGFIRSSLINIGFTMGLLMGLLWDSSYGIPYGDSQEDSLRGFPWRFLWGFPQDSYGNGMGMGTEILFPRQPCQLTFKIYDRLYDTSILHLE